MRSQFILSAIAAACFLGCPLTTAQDHQSLDGKWEIRSEGSNEWRIVDVPATFEQQIKIDFDGKATLKKTFDAVKVEPGVRLLLHFDAVATKCKVKFNGNPIGEHLGAWTPFRFDVTDLARKSDAQKWQLEVQVDELVGHNTQGFLPIIAPHFGGIWQSVKLIKVPNTYVDTISTFVYGDETARAVNVDLNYFSDSDHRLEVFIREPGGANPWTGIFDKDVSSNHPNHLKRRLRSALAINDPDFKIRPWTPDDPMMYELMITVTTKESLDFAILPFAFRNVRIDGSRFLLNGKPLNIRGVLNWGYAPPRTAPSLDEDFMRREIEVAKQRGFNLMKFCLWIPPKRYLQLCDEMGMLVWMEYPTWHPDFSEKKLDELRREYDEFFLYDRQHPSVILRSLTCETGPSADLKVIQSLFDGCKQKIPGAIVVDDSSWIQWNRVFDFYDDHPYGNNHDWRQKLTELKEYIAEKGVKPLMLGEAIAADTWTDPNWFDPANKGDDHWQPHFLEPSREWLKHVRERLGEQVTDSLIEDSKHYAMLMRKFQMENFRGDVPNGGYVVSVIRDFPKAAMGLVDFRGDVKWDEDDWQWHGDQMLLLRTSLDQRCISVDGEDGIETFMLGGAGFESGLSGEVEATWKSSNRSFQIDIDEAVIGSDEQQQPGKVLFAHLPESLEAPTRMTLRANALNAAGDSIAQNEWPIWLVPPVKLPTDSLEIHSSINADVRKLFSAEERKKRTESAVLLTSIIDESVIEQLRTGRQVLMLPNDRPGSMPLQSHWFLRGGPVVSNKMNGLIPREMLIELQHFDLADRVVRDIGLPTTIDPLLMLWEAHDLDHIKTNGLVFNLPVGKGNLLVSALKHTGNENAAGKYVLRKLIKALADGEFETDEQRGAQNLNRLLSELSMKKIMLDKLEWKFCPDPNEQGKTDRWFAIDFDDSDWKPIKTNAHWEGQGFASLDNWAWYRITVNLPEDFGEKQYLNFTGVDDHYQLYVNGQWIGSGGDIEKRETAFELRTSHDITSAVTPGEKVQIAIAVYDWYGAGGIFRPVFLSTLPISDKPRLLK